MNINRRQADQLKMAALMKENARMRKALETERDEWRTKAMDVEHHPVVKLLIAERAQLRDAVSVAGVKLQWIVENIAEQNYNIARLIASEGMKQPAITAERERREKLEAEHARMRKALDAVVCICEEGECADCKERKAILDGTAAKK